MKRLSRLGAAAFVALAALAVLVFAGPSAGRSNDVSAADLVTLNERADPVLADLWDNPRDAAYDKL